MPKILSIKAEYDVTVADLISLHRSGYSVFRTSHAGNWSSYKLLLSQLGLPDCVWDVTCMHEDIKNQPQKQFLAGDTMSLLDEPPEKPINGEKHLSLYQRCCNGTHTLSSYHLEPLKKLYGNVVCTQSELLLEEEERLKRVFAVVQKYAPEMIGRYILPCGCMVNLNQVSQDTYKARCKHHTATVQKDDLAASAISTLHELRILALNPKGYIPKGGALYSFNLVVASFLLWSFWKFGDKPIYMLSGPDMIGYATKESFIRSVENVLTLVAQHSPDLIPSNVDLRVVPATLFCFGYPSGDTAAEQVMKVHDEIINLQNILFASGRVDPKKPSMLPKRALLKANDKIEELAKMLQMSGVTWNIFINPAKDVFFSQHDLEHTGRRMTVDEKYLNMPFRYIEKTLTSLQKVEQLLISQFCSKN